MRRRANPALPAVLGLLAVAMFVVAMPADAQAQAGQVLDSLVDRFQAATSRWESAIKSAAISLFWILAAIEFAVSAIFLALSGSGIQNFASEVVKRILVVGIFYFILDQGPAVVDAVIKSFRQIAQNAGGVGFKPSDIFNAGVQVAQKLADNVSFWTDSGKSVALLIAALVVVVCFALIAAIVIVTTVEMWIVTYAGIILLGFGGSGFTKDYAIKYLTYAISVGLKLMVMGLVVSIGQSIISETVRNFSNTSNTEIYTVVGVAIVLLAVTKALPSMLQSVVVGSSVGSNTTLLGVAAGAAGAAMGAVAGPAAVGVAAARGGGSIGQMAGRAIGAVAGAAFDRAASVPGSRMGSVMGNAASKLRLGNQQAARLAAPGGSSGARAARASQPMLTSGSGGGRPPSSPTGGGAGRGTSDNSGFGGGSRGTSSPAGFAGPAAAPAGTGKAEANSAAPPGQSSSTAARTVAGATAPVVVSQAPAAPRAPTAPPGFSPGQALAAALSLPQAGGGAAPAPSEAFGGSSLAAAEAGSNTLRDVAAAVSTGAPPAMTETLSSDAPARPPVQAGSEAVLNPSLRSGAPAGGAPTTTTALPSERVPSATYVSSVPPPKSRPLAFTSTKTTTPRS
ncbi:MAG: P-type conjugative transfer protein TrbL [Methylobacterium sp.]|uniref:P-type conjugative transfer protein TrbL n=1 Tax=Methylobacterium sp. TaxID=409 RepID=UPI0025E0E502|nr:P-type conjugative transfer protein TrbL [Methylobacterium sp.]MBX9933534.1 P-type conjugative transfer protein TrbL [Methylobacterium sp.]